MKQSKIGMIGCGMISEVYAKNITERFGDLQLVACADLRMEAAQARAEQFGAKAMTVDELLADPDIDIVLNLTIPDQHAAVSMAALKAGKNVYSEKPLAIHMQDAKELVEYAKAHNLLLARKYSERPEHVHDGKIIVMRSNLRWCSDGFEFACWNGDIVRGAFIIDAGLAPVSPDTQAVAV